MIEKDFQAISQERAYQLGKMGFKIEVGPVKVDNKDQPQLWSFASTIAIDMWIDVFKGFYKHEKNFPKYLDTIKNKTEFATLLENIYRLSGEEGLSIYLCQQMDEFDEHSMS